MSTRIQRSIGSIAFVSALLVANLGVSAPASTANAVDCVAAPNSSVPQGSHWYYRINRTTQRKCWYLRAANQPSAQGAAHTADDTASSTPSQSVPPAGPPAEHGHARLSDKEVAKLYAEFLEWSRHTRYETGGHQ